MTEKAMGAVSPPPALAFSIFLRGIRLDLLELGHYKLFAFMNYLNCLKINKNKIFHFLKDLNIFVFHH